MIGTLAWKEHREHQGIWLTMAVMTVLVGWGLPRIVSQGDQLVFMSVSLLTIFGMTVAYGVVCGAMMFAGEHEGGTLVFLDIFHGRRGRLWSGKAAIGAVLVITEGLAVALFLWSIGQEPPELGIGPLNRPGAFAFRAASGPEIWFALLPIVALEAFAWGLLGSSVTRRALPGASIGAVGVCACWMFTFCGVLVLLVVVRLTAALAVLAFSYVNFVTQTKEASLRAVDLEPTAYDGAREAFLERYDEFEREDELLQRWAERDRAASTPDMLIDRGEPAPTMSAPRRNSAEPDADASSPREVLWWLIFEQYRTLVAGMALGCFLAGFVVSAYAQILWPVATLILGVVCGVAAFAPEQRDLSYQFLAAEHLPLRAIWRFKILFWGAAAVALTVVLALGTLAGTLLQMQNRRPDGFAGPLFDLMGPVLFFGVWLAYGFGIGQIVVWLCRKNILALLLSLLIAGGAIGLWLPSLIAGGMNGWQLWATPALLLLAGWCLVRAWAGGRMQERRPRIALAGFVALGLTWALVVFACRAWEIPDAGPPIDVAAFRAGIPLPNEDRAAKEIHAALGEFGQLKRGQIESIRRFQVPFGAHDVDKTLSEARSHLKEAAQWPNGVLETPRADGMPALLHLPQCKAMAEVLLIRSRQMDQADAAASVSEVLTLSRNLRNMAPIESYLAGIEIETMALTELDVTIDPKKPTVRHLRQILDDLNQHSAQTPPALDCIRTECFRSTGMVLNPQSWNLAVVDDRRPPSWLRGSIGLSLETPWESERKTRLWRLAWAGLLRGFDTPDWELAKAGELPPTRKSVTRKILVPWLPGNEGVSRPQMTRLLDSSWLADEKLLCSADTLRIAALRSKVRVDLTRLAIALALHRMEEHGPPDHLGKLKGIPAGGDVDPYTGQLYRYSNGPGTPRVWSTGPDRVDDGGRRDGAEVPDDDPRWRTGKLDLVKNEPMWP